MHFKKPADSPGEETSLDIYIRPRTLVLFSGEARYSWMHSIAQRKIDKVEVDPEEDDIRAKLKFRHRRVSLTFRKVKFDGPCRCKYPRLCDSQNKSVAVEENMLSGEAGEAPVYKAATD